MTQQPQVRVNQDYVEKLFVHLYCDLGQRSEAQGDFRMYHQLNMARLLRQLLIDGSSGVFSQANRDLRLPIAFVVPQIGTAPDNLRVVPEIYSGSLPKLDEFPPGYYLHPYKLEGFLNYSPLILAGRVFKVADIIKYIANTYGGVHLAPSLKDEDEQLLTRFNESVIVGEEGIVLSRINLIASFVLQALAPLKRAIEAKHNWNE